MNLKPYLNRATLLGGIGFAALLLTVTLILVGWASPRLAPPVGLAPADVTLIPAPTRTPNITAAVIDPNATPTLAAGSIGISAYVQIRGTEGEGLRIRAAPGLSSDTVFFGGESEVFLVRDGPQTADGYIWWYLVAPYDDTRAGWAAAEFLSVIPAP
ncbi:MAG: hypothetical protein Fur002_25960 [Anaerolineales bacterium]